MGKPEFHPGASASAPGLVVTLPTTSTKAGTPLVGPATNLAGVLRINGVTSARGLTRTWNDWHVTSPGFFGQNTDATLTELTPEPTHVRPSPATASSPLVRRRR